MVDGTHQREQGEEQHGEGGGHDQVGQIDDRLEELLSPDVQPVAGEENRQQQRDDDLGNRAAQPQGNGVPGILQNIDGAVLVRGEQLHIVGKSHIFGAHLLQTHAVIFKEAVVDGQKLGIQGKNPVDNKKGRDENIAPLGIADTLALWSVGQSFHRTFLLHEFCLFFMLQPDPNLFFTAQRESKSRGQGRF